MKLGLYVGNHLVCDYETHEYLQALEDAKFAYEESGEIHEIKIITK